MNLSTTEARIKLAHLSENALYEVVEQAINAYSVGSAQALINSLQPTEDDPVAQATAAFIQEYADLIDFVNAHMIRDLSEFYENINQLSG